MRIGIVGGGIGGLALSLCLQKENIPSEVFEAAPELKPLGAGIVVALNGMRVLEHLGLAPAALAAGEHLTGGDIVDHQLRPISQVRFEGLERQFGLKHVALLRSQLHQLLLAKMPGGALHLGKRLVRFTQEESGATATAWFADGTHQAFDALVGADGIHSPVRQQLFPRSTLRYSGQTSWRGVTEFDLAAATTQRTLEAWGLGRRFGFVSVGGGKVYWFAVSVEPQGEKATSGNTEKDAVLQRFRGYAPLVTDLIVHTPSEAIVRTDISDLRHLSRWHHGRVALLGDAAHATTPNLGQGGNQALEDAYRLAQALAHADSVEAAFRDYFLARSAKARFVVDRSWQLGQVAHWQNGTAVWLRNTALRTLPAEMNLSIMKRLYVS